MRGAEKGSVTLSFAEALRRRARVACREAPDRPRTRCRRLAVAAVSARMLAEAAARDGYAVVALDCFGDVDTRRASAVAGTTSARHDGGLRIDAGRRWRRCATAAAGADVDRLDRRQRLRRRARSARAAARRCCRCSARRRRRCVGCATPRSFFERLDALGIAHPETRFDPPPHGAGLAAQGRRRPRRLACPRRLVDGEDDAHAAAATSSARRRARRCRRPSSPIAARHARSASTGSSCGPSARGRSSTAAPSARCTLPPGPAGAVLEAVQALTREFAIARSGQPRLPARRRHGFGARAERAAFREHGALRRGLACDAHVRCLHEGELPTTDAARASVAGGTRSSIARRPLHLSAAAAAALEAAPHCHDLPAAGTRFARGDPVCSHDARAADVARLDTLLAAQREALWNILETP